MYRAGRSSGEIGRLLGMTTPGVCHALKRMGVQCRPRGERDPATKARYDKMVQAYVHGKTLHEVGAMFGVSWATVQGLLVRRGIPRRSAEDFRRAQAPRDRRIIAMYKRGLPPREIAPHVGLAASGVSQVLIRHKVPRRKAADYPTQEREAWKAIKARVASIAHLHNTGPKTSAKDLARRVGLAASTVRKHLWAQGIEVRNGVWRDGPGLGSAGAKRLKAALAENRWSLAELASRFGIGKSGVRAVADGKSWKHIPWPHGKKYKPEPVTKLTIAKVARIKRLLAKQGPSLTAISQQFGVTTSTIQAIADNRTWTHVPWPRGGAYVRRTHGKPKLARAVVERIKAALSTPGHPSFDSLAMRFGVHAQAVSGIAFGRSWRHVPWPGDGYVPMGHGRPNKLTATKVAKIKEELTREVKTMTELAFEYGIAVSGICSIAMNRSWQQVPWPKGTQYQRRPSGRRAWDRQGAEGGGLIGPMDRNLERRSGERFWEESRGRTGPKR